MSTNAAQCRRHDTPRDCKHSARNSHALARRCTAPQLASTRLRSTRLARLDLAHRIRSKKRRNGRRGACSKARSFDSTSNALPVQPLPPSPPPTHPGALPPGDPRDLGCCPYLQLFKGGKLVFTTTMTPSSGGTNAQGDASGDGGVGSSVTWAYPSDQSVAFSVDAVLQGDMLLRCRHLTSKGTRVSMFRAGFHTGWVQRRRAG